ncbi:hypothetical protein BDR05DRAFT_956639, partial [Suillus weaverae]
PLPRPISVQARPQGCLVQSRSAPPLHTTRSSAIAPITLEAHLHSLSSLGPVGARHAPSPIVNVPLAQGKERNAAAGAPRKNEDLIPDEDYVPSCHPSLTASTRCSADRLREHGSGRLCGCF